MSPDISMELCSEASSAGGTHPVLPREEIREADFSLVLWGAFLPISHLFFFYMQACFVVHDLFLVVSVSTMGFCALWGSGFVKHDVFICRMFANFVPCLRAMSPLFFSSCGNCFYVGRSPEGSKEVQASFPIFGLSESLLVQRRQDLCGSGCRQYFHETRVALGSCKANLATVLAPTSLTVHAQGAEGCGMLPASSPGTCRAWWPRESCSRPSHPSPAHLHFGFELAWVRELQGLDMGGKPGRWQSCLT